MKLEVQILVDGKVVLTQVVSRKTLDEEIYPLLEEEANKIIEGRRAK